jgi:hypothetical protein
MQLSLSRPTVEWSYLWLVLMLNAVVCDSSCCWMQLPVTRATAECSYLWLVLLLNAVVCDSCYCWMQLSVTRPAVECSYLWLVPLLNAVICDSCYCWMQLSVTRPIHNQFWNYESYIQLGRARGSVVVETLCYKPNRSQVRDPMRYNFFFN